MEENSSRPASSIVADGALLFITLRNPVTFPRFRIHPSLPSRSVTMASSETQHTLLLLLPPQARTDVTKRQ